MSFILRSVKSSLRHAPSRVGRTAPARLLSTALEQWDEGLPDSIKRVGQAVKFPDEGPGVVYEFNWALNGDGVTPLKRSAFRINKPLDLKVAGLKPPATNPLKVKASPIPEAGSDDLSFEDFDDACQKARDNLSLSDHLYCPEGHVPGTRTGVRVITNAGGSLPSNLVAYLDRCPKTSPPVSMPITCFVVEGADESFAGYSIEEIEVPTSPFIHDHDDDKEPEKEAKSVATVVVTGETASIESIVGGIEASQKALEEDEAEREAAKQQQQQQE